MKWKVGDKVVFVPQGPCRVDGVVMKTIAGQLSRFYRLSLLDDSSDLVFVPSDKLKPPAIRPLITEAELPKVFSSLEGSRPASANWRQRAIEQAKLFASGSAFDLAEIVESLTQMGEGRALLSRDRQTLEKAKRLLICEISEVTGATRSATEERVDRILGLQREHPTTPTVARLRRDWLDTRAVKRPPVNV